jgi:hypothetical protein
MLVYRINPSSHIGRIEYDRGDYSLKFYPYNFKSVVFGCRAGEQNVLGMMSYILYMA